MIKVGDIASKLSVTPDALRYWQEKPNNKPTEACLAIIMALFLFFFTVANPYHILISPVLLVVFIRLTKREEKRALAECDNEYRHYRDAPSVVFKLSKQDSL